mmetsp:Transcript_2557/g.4498  ORF Transcript_2557/g.4498 Transcript_2557/m.4498 type:complete len:84 (+) Transcript_2557:1772-2023(+)
MVLNSIISKKKGVHFAEGLIRPSFPFHNTFCNPEVSAKVFAKFDWPVSRRKESHFDSVLPQLNWKALPAYDPCRTVLASSFEL